MSTITPKLSRSVLHVRAHNVPRVLTFVWVVEDVCHRRLGSCCPFEITPIIMTRNSSAGTQHSLGPWFQDATKIGFLVGNNADGLLETRTCAVAHRFSPLAAEDGGAIILSFACSGSGRSIAVCLFEYPTDIVVHVASMDDHGGFRVRCFQEEGFHGMDFNSDPLLHVCFLGQAASELVAVNNRNGKVFWLGSEVLNHGNEHGHEHGHGQDQSMMFRPLPFVPMQGSMLSSCHFSGDIITAVTHVCGSCIMVAIVLRRPNGNGHQFQEFQVVDGTVHFTEHPVEVKSRAITPFMTGNMVHISQEVDVGVTVRGPSSWSVLPYLYSMQLGELRQCWMEACIRAIARKFYW